MPAAFAEINDFSRKKTWTSPVNPLHCADFMKSETTNTMLVFVLGFFVVLDVLFAVRAVTGQREFRSLQLQASQSQTGLIQIQQLQGLVRDVQEYDKLHPSPELNRILTGLKAKPAAPAKPATR